MSHTATCPIKKEFTVLELQTNSGSRWYGFSKAWVNSELRMIVQGFNEKDETLSKWEICYEY